jgi:hypothetical protein
MDGRRARKVVRAQPATKSFRIFASQLVVMPGARNSFMPAESLFQLGLAAIAEAFVKIVEGTSLVLLFRVFRQVHDVRCQVGALVEGEVIEVGKTYGRHRDFAFVK